MEECPFCYGTAACGLIQDSIEFEYFTTRLLYNRFAGTIFLFHDLQRISSNQG